MPNNTQTSEVFKTSEVLASLRKSYLQSMENSPGLKALIRKNAGLFWYIKPEAKENLPLSVVTEFF